METVIQGRARRARGGIIHYTNPGGLLVLPDDSVVRQIVHPSRLSIISRFHSLNNPLGYLLSDYLVILGQYFWLLPHSVQKSMEPLETQLMNGW